MATWKLLRFIDEFAPDVVHIHELHAYFVNIAPLMAYLKKKKIKTIWTFHCEFMYTGKCGHAYDCNEWLKECGNCPYLRDYPSSLLFDHTRSMFHEKRRLLEDFEQVTIVTPSEWLAGRVRQSFLGKKNITVIPNGVDTNVFCPRDTSPLRSKYKTQKAVVHVTPNFGDKRKGGHYILELARRMPDVAFFVVGNKKPVQNLPPNVQAVGRTENQAQLAEWYSFADVSVITSERENFPTVCLESLCCGTPIVGFAGGGTSETAPEGYGIFAPYADLPILESALHRALNGELRKKADCAEFGRAKYAKEEMIRHYLELYQGHD
jgi:glycosyltransferase involved in cell wall biosynthesis